MRDLLRALFEGLPEKNYIEVSAFFADEGRMHSEFFTSVEEAEQFVEQWKRKADVFFGVCPRVRKRGTAQDIAYVPAFWVDLDLEGEFDLTTWPRGCPLPSFVVSSGTTGHYHLYWLLDEPCEPDDKARRISAGLHSFLEADATHDLTRKLRVPGSFNRKTRPAKSVTVTHGDAALRYPLLAFEHLAAEVSGKMSITLGEPESVDLDQVDIRKNVRSLIEEGLESEYAERFKRPDGTVDRSRFDMAIASALAGAGLGPNQIHGVFAANPCSGRFSSIRHAIPYLEHTIAAALARREQTVITVDFSEGAKATVQVTDPCPMPKEGWLKDYALELDKQTEAPISFHLHAGLCVLSAVLGSTVRLPNRVFARHPNIFALLVGESGTTGKSTVLSLARSTILHLIPDYPIYGDFTTEALAKESPPSICFLRGELSSLISLARKKYGADIIPSLAELYDGEMSGKLRATVQSTKGKSIAVTALFGTTMSWLRKTLEETQAEIEGGLFPRFLIVIEKDTGKSVPFPSKAIWALPQDFAAAIYPKVQDFIKSDTPYLSVLSPVAIDVYTKWYETYRHQEVRLTPNYASVLARLRTTVFKVALLTQVSVDGMIVVGEEAMRYATRLCDWHARKVTAFLGIVDPFEDLIHKISQIVQVRGVATKTEVYRALYGKRPREVQDVIQTLVNRGLMEQVDLRVAGARGRPATGYRWSQPDDAEAAG